MLSCIFLNTDSRQLEMGMRMEFPGIWCGPAVPAIQTGQPLPKRDQRDPHNPRLRLLHPALQPLKPAPVVVAEVDIVEMAGEKVPQPRSALAAVLLLLLLLHSGVAVGAGAGEGGEARYQSFSVPRHYTRALVRLEASRFRTRKFLTTVFLVALETELPGHSLVADRTFVRLA